MSVKHDHEHERTKHTMSRLQQHQTQSRLALCPRAVLDAAAHRWVPARTPSVPESCGCGWLDTTSTRRPPTNDNKTQTSTESNVFSATGALTHLESYMVAELVLETGDLRICCQTPRTNTSSTKSKWRRPESSKKITQRNETHHPREDQTGDRTHQDSPESVH